MSLFQRLTRTLRSTPFNPASTLRPPKSPCAPKMGPYFFGSGSYVGLGRRFYYSSFNRHESSNMKLIYGIIGLNTGIFLYAQYLKEQARQGFPQPMITYLQNMSLSLYGVLREGRYWTTVTSVFSHIDPMHIIGNMLSFYYMGQLLACTPTFTPLRLLTIILGSGLAGSAGYLYTAMQSATTRQGNPRQMALGFSGAVMGVGTIAAFLYPKTTFMIYGIVPVPLWGLMAGYAFYDGYYLNDRGSRTAHSGHLGGLAFGILYYLAKLRGLRV
ncbi:hypothetical protein N0V90_002790 [Kalmusia sp. IMI 367209]|nr:hypothetical protein N0V90_002790 [Kalmusia sp. IMI 367209]